MEPRCPATTSDGRRCTEEQGHAWLHEYEPAPSEPAQPTYTQRVSPSGTADERRMPTITTPTAKGDGESSVGVAAQNAPNIESTPAPASGVSEPKPFCMDCNAPYADDGWCDVVIPNQIGKTIASDDGLLRFSCMTKRLIRWRFENVPVAIRSGPYQMQELERETAPPAANVGDK